MFYTAFIVIVVSVNYINHKTVLSAWQFSAWNLLTMLYFSIKSGIYGELAIIVFKYNEIQIFII